MPTAPSYGLTRGLQTSAPPLRHACKRGVVVRRYAVKSPTFARLRLKDHCATFFWDGGAVVCLFVPAPAGRRFPASVHQGRASIEFEQSVLVPGGKWFAPTRLSPRHLCSPRFCVNTWPRASFRHLTARTEAWFSSRPARRV